MDNKLEEFKEWLKKQDGIVRVIVVNESSVICEMIGELSMSIELNNCGFPKTMEANAYNGKVNIGEWYINGIDKCDDNWIIIVSEYHNYIIKAV